MSADNVLKANLEEAAGVLRERLGNRKPAVGIVLGSASALWLSKSRMPSSSRSARFPI